MAETGAIVIAIIVAAVVVLPASAYLITKYATMGYWAGFKHSLRELSSQGRGHDERED